MTGLTNDPVLGMYVAAAVAVAVVVGLFIYLWAIDRRVNEIRRALSSESATPPQRTAEPLRPRRRIEVQEEQIHGNDSH